MKNSYMEPTATVLQNIQRVLSKIKLPLMYKVWETKEFRDIGEPIYLEAPESIQEAIQELPSYEEGGCVEIVTDDGEQYCLYHKEENLEYVFGPDYEQLLILEDELERVFLNELEQAFLRR